jgi:hypothetical protein
MLTLNIKIMSKKYGISLGILVVVLLSAGLLIGCKSGGTKPAKDDVAVNIPKNNTAAIEDIQCIAITA